VLHHNTNGVALAHLAHAESPRLGPEEPSHAISIGLAVAGYQISVVYTDHVEGPPGPGTVRGQSAPANPLRRFEIILPAGRRTPSVGS